MSYRPWKFYTIAFGGAFFGGFVNILILVDFDVSRALWWFVSILLVSMNTYVMMDTLKGELEDKMP